MYCDFCGKILVTNVKYCRHCGRRLRDRLEDTRPLPVITDTMLSMASSKRQTATAFSWPNLPLLRRPSFNKEQLGKKLQATVSFAVIVVLLYVMLTFKTVEEYQILTAIGVGLLTVYTWRKNK